MIIKEKAYPRAGLVGNPSDGFFGKTIAFAFSNFHAEITMWESPEIDLVPSLRDHSHFPNIRGLVEDVELLGYYGGIRLLKAAIKRFCDHCDESGVKPPRLCPFFQSECRFFKTHQKREGLVKP